MQVFIRRSDLAGANKGAVRVFGYYEDHVHIAANAHGPGMAVLSLPYSALVNGQAGMTLASNWRDTYREQMAAGEAERRVRLAIPDPGLIALELAVLTAQHGAGQWPKEAQARRAEIERAWGYVNEVRRKAKGLATASPLSDPTADTHWPTRI